MPSSTEPTRIAVKAELPYQVLVGYDLLAEVPPLLGYGVQRVALLHPPTMIKTAERLAQLLTSAGLEPIRIDVPDAEAAKSVAVAERCWSILGNAGFTRSDAVVGLGGGDDDFFRCERSPVPQSFHHLTFRRRDLNLLRHAGILIRLYS